MNGFRWKICWRLKPEYRTGSRSDRRWTLYMYRKGRPNKDELAKLARTHPMYEFRGFRIGQGC